MPKNKIQYILFLLFIIIVLFFCSVAFVLLIKGVKTSPTVSDGDVSFVADSNTIIIKSILSVSKEFGKTIHEDNGGAFGYLKFEVVNQTDEVRNYQIYITKQSIAKQEINSNYMIFYLTDENDQPFEYYQKNKLPSYVDLVVIRDKPDSKLLYQGMINGSESKKFILRVWISDSYLVMGTDDTFSFEIGARAI